MAILKISPQTAFDKSLIKKNEFIRAQYIKWDEPQNGIVASVTDNEIRVLYIPSVGNVTNYFNIFSDEVKKGLWSLSWSNDLKEVIEVKETEEIENDS